VTQGTLPAQYSRRFAEAMDRVTPEQLRTALEPYLSPQELEGTMLRYEIIKADIKSKHPRLPFLE
jgi:hypothetical protein